MRTLTDEQVVRRLAGRDAEHGSDVLDELRFDELAVKEALGTITRSERAELDRIDERRGIGVVPDYITSLDALSPVLKGLTDGEWSDLSALLLKQRKEPYLPCMSEEWKWLLTLPPHTLAHAIAEVLPAP